MEEQFQKDLAAQLRKPSGEMGKEVAGHMNKGNAPMNLHGIEQLQIAPGDHILEIGMGNAYFVKEMLKPDPSIIYSGCDFSETMVEEARNLHKEALLEERVRFFHSPADNLPFEDGTFDKIITANTIYFWDKPAVELTEIRRVSKSGARFVLIMRSDESLKIIPFTRFGFHIYSKPETERFFRDSGWKIEEIKELEEENQRLDGEKMLLRSWIVIARA